MVYFGLKLEENKVSSDYFKRKESQVNNVKGYFKNPFSDFKTYYKEGCQIVKFNINRTNFTKWLIIGIVACFILALEVPFLGWFVWVAFGLGVITIFNLILRSNNFFYLNIKKGLRKSGFVGKIKKVSKAELFLIDRDNGTV